MHACNVILYYVRVLRASYINARFVAQRKMLFFARGDKKVGSAGLDR